VGRYRQVFDCLWVDGWFRGLPDDARLLWVYLLTCEHWHGSLPGLFRCRPETMAADLAWTSERLRKALAAIVESGRAKTDEPTGLVWIVKAHTYLCTSESSETMRKHWPRMLMSLAECPLRDEAWSSISESVSGKLRARVARSDPTLPVPGSRIPDPGSKAKTEQTVCKEFAKTEQSVPARLSSPLQAACRPSADLTPYWPDIAEAIRAAWEMTETPPVFQGNDMDRVLQAYRFGEEKSPGHGVARIVWAVWGHHKAAVAEGADKRYRAPKYAFPPVLSDGRASWGQLDLMRFHEYAEAGRKLVESAERRAKNEEAYQRGLSGHG
jgi:hypothetical protein